MLSFALKQEQLSPRLICKTIRPRYGGVFYYGGKIMSCKTCVICKEIFKPTCYAKTCSSDCRLENDRRNRILQKRRARDRQNGYVIPEFSNCVVCGYKIKRGRKRKICSDECVTATGENNYRSAVRKVGKTSINGTRSSVKSQLKIKLGVDPPADLVEEATALRLLNRALRNIS